jgi:hypothetical protein
MHAQNHEAHVFLTDKFHILNIFIPSPIIWQIDCVRSDHVDHFILLEEIRDKFPRKLFLIWIFQETLSETLTPVYELDVSNEKFHYEIKLVGLRERTEGKIVWDKSFLCESSVPSVVFRVKVITNLCPLHFEVQTN